MVNYSASYFISVDKKVEVPGEPYSVPIRDSTIIIKKTDHLGNEKKKDWKKGTVIEEYKYFIVLQFDNGVRECFLKEDFSRKRLIFKYIS